MKRKAGLKKKRVPMVTYWARLTREESESLWDLTKISKEEKKGMGLSVLCINTFYWLTEKRLRDLRQRIQDLYPDVKFCWYANASLVIDIPTNYSIEEIKQKANCELLTGKEMMAVLSAWLHKFNRVMGKIKK